MKKRDATPLLLLLLFAGGGGARPCRGGPTLSLAELRALAKQHGFADPILAAAVAMAESGGHLRCMGDFGLGAFGFTSFGLWQIHTPAHPKFRGVDLFDPDANAKAAMEISRGGTKWSDWTTFNKGLHLPYMTP